MGKLTRHLAVYDALPSLDDTTDDDYEPTRPPRQRTGPRGGHAPSTLADESLMSLVEQPEPKSMAAIAENTRSQLLAMHPSVSSSQLAAASDSSHLSLIAAAPPPCAGAAGQQQQQQQVQPGLRVTRNAPASSRSVSFAIDSCSVMDEAAVASDDVPSAEEPAKSQPARTRRMVPPASMMTHPASRMTTGRVGGNPCASMRAPHTFGSLPRASPSGTMPHHAPKALPTAAVAATTVPRARRTRRLDEESSEATASSPVKPLDLSSADVEVHAPERPKAPSPAPPPALLKRSATAKSAAAAAAPQGRGARAPPRRSPPSNEPTVWRRRQRRARVPARRAAPAAGSRRGGRCCWWPRPRLLLRSRAARHSTFAFVVMCCGDEYGDFCCKRHHPDETIYCRGQEAGRMASRAAAAARSPGGAVPEGATAAEPTSAHVSRCTAARASAGRRAHRR